jgi:hypothetical protein
VHLKFFSHFYPKVKVESFQIHKSLLQQAENTQQQAEDFKIGLKLIKQFPNHANPQ